MTTAMMRSIKAGVKAGLFMRNGEATYQSRTAKEWRQESGYLLTADERERAVIIADILEATTAQRKRAKLNREARHELLLSCGLKRVRGALGGVYYE